MSTAKSLVRRHPVPAYFALTFAISWGGVLAVVWTASTPEQIDALLPLEILAMLGGPAVAGLAMTGVVRGKEGLRELLSRLLRWRVGARWYAVALLTAPIVTLVMLLGLSLASPVFVPGLLASGDRTSLLAFGLAAGAAVGVLEELGWTGFAVPELRRRHSVVRTALVLGVAWGAWHILTNGILAVPSHAGTVPPAQFVIARAVAFLVGALPAFRLLMLWVWERTGSLLVAMLMHASLTASTLVLQPLAAFGKDLLLADLVSIAVWWGVVAAVAASGRGRVHRLRGSEA